jgi:N-acyl-D-amino-acid deacylase
MRILRSSVVLICLAAAGASPAPTRAQQPPSFDVVIRGGTVYDGTGSPGGRADVGIRGDRIAAVGDLAGARATTVVDAAGLAVAPGFVNMLSWSTESLLADGRSQGEIRQGVTTQIFGEGSSMGPLNDAMKRRAVEQMGDIKYEITWTTLSEYLQGLERRGVSQNVASFVGATTIREHVIGLEDRKPTPAQMEEMRALVRQEMEAGALGIGSSLIYAPAFYASTEELIELCKVAAKYRGKYISHIRSEGNRLLEAVDELIRISREANIPAEIYHLKAAGRANWPKMGQAIAKIEAARGQGLRITADMYTYPAGATGLDASMPPWVLDGGYDAAYKRLRDPEMRKKIAQAIRAPGNSWENLYLAAGSADRVLLIEFKSDKLKPLTGKTLAEAATLRGEDPVDTIMNLVAEDQSRVGAVYFMMSEDNIRRQIALPWVSFGSDASSMAPEPPFTKSSAHPRAYGNFARVLGKYVRDEKVIPLEEAVRKLSGLPATNLELDRRGFLKEGMFADVVVFDPATIADRATFENPHQYAVGMKHVFVNGAQVLKDGTHTGAKPGRALWGVGKIASPPQTGDGAGRIAPARFVDPDRRAKLSAAFGEIDRLFKDFTTRQHVPGAAWGIVIDGELAHDGVDGYRDVAAKAPVDADTVFRIASMTKSFTAMSILKLRDEGKLVLDDPAETYVPELKGLVYPTSDSPRITVRHLLSHAEGFPEDNPWGDQQLGDTDEQLTQMLKSGIPFSNAPGVAYEYSNYGFAILGRIVSRVSGMPYRDYVARNILRPLGMTSTTLEPALVPQARLARGYRWEDGVWKPEPLLPDGSFGSMGGMLTSVRDLSRYVGAFLAAWPPRDGPDAGPIRRSSLREMQQIWRPRTPSVAKDASSGAIQLSAGGYGFGLGISQTCGFAHVVAHSGGLPGFGSLMRWLPEYGVGVIAFGNLTYTGWGRVADSALDQLAKTGALQPRVPQPSPALMQAREQVSSLVVRWDDALADSIAAGNLFLDRSKERRRAELEDLHARLGTCALAASFDNVENALRGQWVMTCERGQARVSITLAPTIPPRVQLLEVAQVPPSGEPRRGICAQ